MKSFSYVLLFLCFFLSGVTAFCEEAAVLKVTINKNKVPYDKRSALVTSGIRIGTPAITTRGMGTDEIDVIAEALDELFLHTKEDENNMPIIPDWIKREVKPAIDELCLKFPLYPGLMQQYEFVAEALNIRI